MKSLYKLFSIFVAISAIVAYVAGIVADAWVLSFPK
jgi:hypothetical protein